MAKQVKQLDRVIIRFAGDSGDGMQLTGDRFTQESAAFGNDLMTLPNFPAEIRAPQGTLPGVSSFQVHFADHDILTAGDSPDVLVAMNPAALKANLPDMRPGTSLIVDSHDFTGRNLTKAGYADNPLEDDSLADYALSVVDLTGMTVEAVKEFGLSRKDAARAKNMFALGLLSWMYGRPIETTTSFLEKRFAKVPDIRDANVTAFKSGWNFGETTEAFAVQYEIKPAPMSAGLYRNITGNLALAYGLVAGSVQSGLPIFLGTYPITPASDILHELSKHKRFGITTFQAEDEIAGIGAALGASFVGSLGVTSTSGSGHRAEVGDHRPRGDDRAAAGRHRRAARRALDRAADQDRAGRPAAGDVRPQRRVPGADRRAAVTRRLLRRRRRGDPDRGHLPDAGDAALRRHAGQRLRAVADPRPRRPARHRPRLRRPRPTTRASTRPGTPPRTSGPTCATRRRSRVRGRSPAPPVSSTASVASRRATGTATSPTTRATTTTWSGSGRPRSTGSPSRCRRSRSTTPAVGRKVLVLGWGSTYGPIGAACRRVRKAGMDVAQVHLRHLNPFPKDLGEILKRYDAVMIPEMNLGQLSMLIRAKYLVDVVGYNHVRGLPLKAAELAEAITDLISTTTGEVDPGGIDAGSPAAEESKETVQ